MNNKMKQFNIIISVVLFTSLMTNASCNASETVSDQKCVVVDTKSGNENFDQNNQKMVAEIYHLFHAWRNAVKKGDATKVANLVTEDAEFWTNGFPPLKGRAALEEAFRPYLAKYVYLQDFECYELIVRSNIAFSRGVEHNTKIPRNGGTAITTRQRAFSVIRKSSDGKWLFSRGMSNLPAKGN